MKTCCGNNREHQMITKSKRIVEGWTNLITKKYQHTKFVKERAQICNRCVHRNKSSNMCKLCGCYIPAKITVKKEKCPFNYWVSVK